jgi:hypothetical protein
MTSQHVIRSYFVIAGLYTLAAALIWGVNTLFLLAAGLDIFGVFIANAAFTAGMVVFEIPTGVFDDTRGRRALFLMSIALLCATTLAYVGVAKAHGGPFLQWGFLTWGFYAWQPYFLELLGRDAVWVSGAVAAAIALATIVGNAVVDRFSQFCGRRTTLLLWASGVQTAAAVGVGVAGSFWLAVMFFLLVAAAMGVTGPVKQAYIHETVPSGQRASVISFDSMIGNAGGVLGQSGLGYLSQARSIAEGYMVGGLPRYSGFPYSWSYVPTVSALTSSSASALGAGPRALRRACRKSRR